jgi:hypothetical protein
MPKQRSSCCESSALRLVSQASKQQSEKRGIRCLDAHSLGTLVVAVMALLFPTVSIRSASSARMLCCVSCCTSGDTPLSGDRLQALQGPALLRNEAPDLVHEAPAELQQPLSLSIAGETCVQVGLSCTQFRQSPRPSRTDLRDKKACRSMPAIMCFFQILGVGTIDGS